MINNLLHSILSSKPVSGPLVVSIVGSGGKTSLMMYLSKELSKQNYSVLITTTTKIYLPSPQNYHALSLGPLDNAFTLCRAGAITCGASALLDDKLIGYPLEEISVYDASKESPDIILVEADGAAEKPLKIHRKDEPVLPPFTHLTLIVVGLSSYGKTLTSHTIHRLNRQKLNDLTGCTVTASVIARITKQYIRAVKNRMTEIDAKALSPPPILIFNQTDAVDAKTTTNLLKYFFPDESIYFTQLASKNINSSKTDDLFQEQVIKKSGSLKLGAVILAAGESTRMGKNKLNLPFKNSTLLHKVVRCALAINFSTMTIVTGKFDHEIRATLPTTLDYTFNKNYTTGQSSSLKSGLKKVSQADIDSCIFFLGDQPLITPEIIDTLITSFIETESDILVPMYKAIPGNPVIFSEKVFPELFKISGDTGGRELFSHPDIKITRLEIDHKSIVTDIDTKKDYDFLLFYSKV